MACTPATLAAGGECYNCALGTKQLWAAAVYLLCSGQASGGNKPAQILAYSTLPTLDGITPSDPNSPAIAVQPGGTTYTWDPVLHVWDDGALMANLVGYYKFDVDGSDAVGGNTATVGGGSSINVGGIINDYLQCTFGGAGAKIAAVPAAFQLGAGVSQSVSMWIKPNLGQNVQAFIYDVYDSGTVANCSLLVYIAGGKINVVAYCLDGSNPSLQPINQPSNAWHHLAFGYDSASKQLWIQLDAGTRFTQPTTADVRSGNTAWWVGNSATATTYFQGGIDEVAVWKNRVITPSEVSSLYNGGAALPISSYPSTP